MKNLSKKTINILTGVSLLAGVLMFNSCSRDNLLDLSPINSADEKMAFTDPDLIKLSVTGVYNAAQIGSYNGAPRGYPFGAAYFQQNDMRGEDMVSTAGFYQYTYTSTWDASGTLNNIVYWADTYRLINRANLVIEGVKGAVQKGVIPQDLGNSYIGEALFFRAMSHLELLKFYARPYNFTAGATHPGVPYRTKGIYSLETIDEGLNQGRGTVAENYKQILDDLNTAESYLYTKTQRAGKEKVSRITKEAAIALKTRVYLGMRNWQKVIEEANKLDGKYSIEGSINTVFTIASSLTNNESVFSLENSATNNPQINGALGAMYNGRKLIAISPVIWNNGGWLVDDKRREEGTMVISSGAKYTNKYKDPALFTDSSPLIRYAEVLLNRAEAKARLGDASYLADLNKVRNRSLASPSQAYTSASFSSNSDAVKAILLERRIEFLGEGMRWADIHRLQLDDIAPIDGIPAKYANALPAAADYKIGTPYVFKVSDQKAIPASNNIFLWPIPANEIASNPTLKGQQNPGW
ncbi:RagB/SusD family nutrient uptake outer membrane protein [Elizabethkingia anophelis]|nr:RagB/SusD family nutrient uptake outer membrane protein [Elizabethkingia anophelis]MDV4084682.1 RagB/SusD family nutrient uptake outer membrane protein [Elizabethkingia anophelis]